MNAELLLNKRMSAICCLRYGSPEVLQPRRLPIPEPLENQVLIRVMSTSVTRGDMLVRAGSPLAIRFFTGLFKPKNEVLGHEFAGVIDAVGAGVSKWKVGEKVMGSLGMKSGAYAEYLVTETKNITTIPENIEFESAAVSQVGGLTALWFLNKVDIQPGQKVLIFGASGSVGSAALQFAHAKGAIVDGVCGPHAIETVSNLGANAVFDYHNWNPKTQSQSYDVVFDAAGKFSLNKAQFILNQGGRYATVSYRVPLVLSNKLNKERQIESHCGLMRATDENRDELRTALANQTFRPLIDRCFHWNQLPQAHEYAEQAKKLGNIPVRFFTDEN